MTIWAIRPCTTLATTHTIILTPIRASIRAICRTDITATHTITHTTMGTPSNPSRLEPLVYSMEAISTNGCPLGESCLSLRRISRPDDRTLDGSGDGNPRMTTNKIKHIRNYFFLPIIFHLYHRFIFVAYQKSYAQSPLGS